MPRSKRLLTSTLRSAKTEGVAPGPSATLTTPLFSATKISPSGAKAAAVGM